jgi:hypothetical protein
VCYKNRTLDEINLSFEEKIKIIDQTQFNNLNVSETETDGYLKKKISNC